MAGYGALLFFGLPVLGLLALLLALVVVVRRLSARGVRWSQVTDPQARRWRTVSVTAWWVGVVVAAVVVATVAAADDLGRGLMLGPVVLALMLVLVTAAGELITARLPRRRCAEAEVTLEVRTVGALVPLGRRVFAVLGVASLLLTTGAASLVSRADDMGRAGRVIPYRSTLDDGGATSWGQRGPWPGWYYSVPIWVVLAVLVVAALWVLRLVVDRPRSGPSARERFLDDVIRRTSAQRVVGLVALAGFGTAALTAQVALLGLDGAASTDVIRGTSVNLYAVGWVCLILLVVGWVASLVAVVQLLAPDLPADAAPDREAEKVAAR